MVTPLPSTTSVQVAGGSGGAVESPDPESPGTSRPPPVETKRRVRGVDEGRLLRRQGVVSEPPRLHDTRSCGLDEDVRATGEATKSLVPCFAVEVDGDALLPGIQGEVQASALGVRDVASERPEASQSVALGRFDLDDSGAPRSASRRDA
jgi:hypothetical protein